MQVLHSLWNTKIFYIWAEFSALSLVSASSSDRAKKPLPHPFTLPEEELKNHLSKIIQLAGSNTETLILRLPSGKAGPLSSPWLLSEDYISEKAFGLVDCTVPAVALIPSIAIDLLLDKPVHPLPATAYADSTLFWSKLALFSLELVVREKFVPLVKEGRSFWRAVIDEPDDERLNIFSSSMPPSCLGLVSPLATNPSPRMLVRSFVDSAVDSLVRNSLRGDTLLPPRRGRKPLVAPLPQQFLLSLTSEDPSLNASDEELADFAAALDSWASELEPKTVDMPFRTCFRLEAPSADETWRLGFFLQARDDRSLLVPAGEVWRTRSDVLTLLKKRLKDPQEQLLADLGKAARIFPLLEKSLETARPVDLEMEIEEAYSFLRQSAPLLEQNGFGVLLPCWWQRSDNRLGIKLHLKDAPRKSGNVGPAFFGLDSVIEYDWQLSLGENTLTESEFTELARIKVPLIRV